MCLLLLCVTVMFCKFRFGLVESGKKEESFKDVLPLGEQMAPKWGNSRCSSHTEWQVCDGAQGALPALAHGAWFALRKVVLPETQVVDTWFLPSTNTS